MGGLLQKYFKLATVVEFGLLQKCLGNKVGFFDSKAEQLAVKFIYEFTGESVTPEVCVPCEASIDQNWKGYCVLTEDAIFLVNKYGARGVRFEGIGGTDSWGQYPPGSKGYPTYRFGFRFLNNPAGFTIFSRTRSGGELLFNYLNEKYSLE